MASISKVSNGYRVQLCVMRTRDSSTFSTRREAVAWAARREMEIRDRSTKPLGQFYTLLDAFKDYAEKVAPTKGGSRWELLRLSAFERMEFMPINKKLADVTTNDLAEYRDERLKTVKNSTVLREISLLSSVFDVAVKEWGWIKENPLANMRKPKKPKHREVTITKWQVRGMLNQFAYTRAKVRSVSQAVAVCFLVALRTGMRAKELCTLKWVDVREGYCILHKTKTDPRDVPLTKKAINLIELMRGYDPVYVFGLSTSSLDANFRKYRKRGGMDGFTFHDSRHTAATWIAGRMKSSGMPAQQAVFDLCKMFGWKNIDQALVYYNPSAADIAKRIS